MRNLAYTAPCMHNGALASLRSPDRNAGDLMALLEALTDDSFDRTIPSRVPSGLPVAGHIDGQTP